jgi:hypothetical protein
LVIDQVKEVVQAKNKGRMPKPLFSGPLPIPSLYCIFVGGQLEVGSMEVGSIEVGSIKVGSIEVGSIEVGSIEVESNRWW